MKSIKRNWFFVVLVLFFALILGERKVVFGVERPPILQEEKTSIDNKAYVAGEVVVKFKKDKINLNSTFSLTSQVRKLIFDLTNGYETGDTIKSGNIVVLKIGEGQQVDEVINTLMSDPNVEYAEPNYYQQLTTLSLNDTYKDNLWGLDNFGQSITLGSGLTAIGTSGADIDVRRAWALTTGSTEVVVAVIDSGVAYNHPDLSGVMWDGTSCKDEDGNALGGCLHGYDYRYDSEDNDPLPTDSSHGTHVAGTIAAERNNSKGIAGVAPNVKIMALKFDLSSTAAAKAIDFATQNGVKIINASWGGNSPSSTIYDAIVRFETAGGIFVAAAGNEGEDNESVHHYPSDYTLSNIVAVAATDQNDLLADFSNFGSTSVDVAAPGVDIYSTIDEAALIDYDFNSIGGGSLPSTWTSDLGASWGAYNLGGTGTVNMAIYGDLNYPYVEGVDSYVTSDTVNLSTVSNAKFSFSAACDTENTDPLLGGDFMALEVSGNGTTFTEIARWNEYSLTALGAVPGYYYTYEVGISASDLTSNFKYRLRWTTDTDGSYGGGDGCKVDNFEIITYTDGSDELYDFYQGTSMAAPHVAGLAGYLWSIAPSASMSDIISNILGNGDTLASLAGKTSTGRRINAYNSVVSLGVTAPAGPSVTGLSNDAVAAKSKTFTWSSATPSTDGYRFSIDQSVSGVPTGSYSVGLTGTTYSSGDGTFYIHVQAQDADLAEGAVSTASFILDNTGPEASVTSSATNLFILSFGETLYSDVGATFAIGTDVASRFAVSSEIGISEALVAGSESISIGVTGTPLAGTNVNLLSGTATNNFYDYLTNAGGTLAVFYDGDAWQANPTALNVATSHFPDLITTGQLTLGGSAPETATSITAANNLTLNIGGTGANSSVGLTLGTIITELNDAVFNANLISGTQVDVSTISGLEVGYTAAGAIQWGITGTTLKFSQPIIVSIYLGSAYDSQTLYVYRSESLSVGWTSTGLSSPTCVVSSGYCSFAATQASYFLAASSATPTPTPSPTSAPTSAPSNDSGSNNQSSGPPEAPRCNDRIPIFAPDLFRITTSKGSAKIIFTPVNEQITGYAVMYGHKKGDERYAAIFSPINNNEGEQSFTVNKLNPKITYYFKVTAFNGCVSGPWSDWIPAKPDRKREIHKYKTVIKNKVKTLVNRFL
ncbi:MAG TPA: S8 family serine peptidase [Candidatus Methanoperedens sp.]|nr:S8 family serine peptidase [Candidatus Methanoperedens sp.]